MSYNEGNMKLRKEVSGLHYFDRVSGVHILIDEIKVPKEKITHSPRTVSIALTNICDLKCHFCYAPKNKQTHSFEYLKLLCKELDNCGVLEITLGGGEPTLFPEFTELCNWVWDNTSMGISFTTHGHHLDEVFIKKITGKVSSIRFSIDGIEPRYSVIRRKKLSDLIKKIELVSGKIPFGINCVVSKGQSEELEKVIDLAIKLNAVNVLIIPEHTNGIFQTTEFDWNQIDRIINKYQHKIELLVTYDAGHFLKSETLNISIGNEYLFAHVSADNKIKLNSFDNEGILIQNIENLKEYFLTINPK